MKKYRTFLALLIALAFIAGCVMPCPPCPEAVVEEEYETRAPARIPTTYYDTYNSAVVNAASGSEVAFLYSGTLGIMNGSDSFNVFDVNLTNADHTGSGNTVGVLDVASITGDAHATEVAIQVGTGWDNAAILSGDVSVRNGATGNVTIDMRDYFDATDDDMAHAVLTTNCTDAGTGAEDCDFSVGVVEAGATAETRFFVDADGSVEIGNTNNAGISLKNDTTLIATDLFLQDGSGIFHTTGTNEGAVFFVSQSITYGVTSTVTSAVIPANADVIDWSLVVSTLFNGGTTDVIVCGISGDADKWIDDLDASSAGRNFAGDAADTQQDEWATSFGDVGGSAVTVQCQYTDASMDASTGAATFMLWYRLD